MTSLLHRCLFCGQTTDVSNALVAFTESPHCSQCGLSVSESSLKMQDELASLFARQMIVANVPTTSQQSSNAPLSSVAQYAPCGVYNITQHYHHSAHQASQIAIKERLGHIAVADNDTVPYPIEILRQHNIDVFSLSPSQLSLFEHAGEEQQSRLLQMWKILPQNVTGAFSENLEAKGSPSTQQRDQGVETDLAVSKSSQKGQQNPPAWDVDMGCQGDEICDYTDQNAEPYMVSGYETLAQREYNLSAEQSAGMPGPQNLVKKPSLPDEPTTGSPYNLASDPIYRSKRWWEHTTPEPIEHQYGAFEQMNYYPGCGAVAAHWSGGQSHF